MGTGGDTRVIDLKPPCQALGTRPMRGAWFWGARERVGGHSPQHCGESGLMDPEG